MMVVYSNAWRATSGGSSIATGMGSAVVNQRKLKIGTRRNASCVSVSRPEMIARSRSCAGASRCHFKIGRRFFWRTIPSPPIRAAKTHEANMRAISHLQQAFGKWRLADLTADEIEQYLRWRLKQHARVKTGSG